MKIWLATEDAVIEHEKFMAANGQRIAEAEMRVKASGHTFDLPPVYTRRGNVGVINVSGFLMPGEAGMFRLFGATGYQDIQNAAMEALRDKEATSTMLYVESPGGIAKGVKETADLLKVMGAVKPLSAYAMTANSAAYWLASSASHITLNEMGEAGSIGAVTSLKNYHEAEKKEGIETKVYRSGEYKALGHPSEPFSEKLHAEMQSAIDYMGGLFDKQVAASRKMDVTEMRERMGKGRQFLGARAREVGLVDTIGGIEQALAYAQNHKALLTV